jgi:hypothetical protein
VPQSKLTEFERIVEAPFIAERNMIGLGLPTKYGSRSVARGTITAVHRDQIVKCFLHIAKDEQRPRLLARLDDPTKRWKYNPADVAERALWGDYQEAYADALQRCNTEAAPWYVVPADRRWYRNCAITKILTEQLHAMVLAWPSPPD